MGGTHARLSASKTARWAACPGSLAVETKFPEVDGGSSEHARLGTVVHGMLERILKEGSLPHDYRKRLVELINPDTPREGISVLPRAAKWPNSATRVIFEIDDEVVEALESAVFYIHKRCGELDLICPGVATLGTERDRAQAVKKCVEQGTVRLEIKTTPDPSRSDMGGTADVVIDAWPICLEVFDYKNGVGVFVPVERNPQLRTYATGALLAAGNGQLMYENIRTTICQPRHHAAPDDGIMYEEITPQELLDWRDTWLFPAVKQVDKACAALDDASKLPGPAEALDEMHSLGFVKVVGGGKHCNFCPFEAGCPAKRMRAQALARVDFNTDSVSDIKLKDGVDDLVKVLPWISVIKSWLKAVEDRAEQVLLDGGNVPGYKLVRGKSNRTLTQKCWVDMGDGVEVEVSIPEEWLVDLAQGQFDLEDEHLLNPPKLRTGPQIMKALPKEQRLQFENTMMHRPDGALKLVTLDHPDQAYSPAQEAANDFKDEEF